MMSFLSFLILAIYVCSLFSWSVGLEFYQFSSSSKRNTWLPSCFQRRIAFSFSGVRASPASLLQGICDHNLGLLGQSRKTSPFQDSSPNYVSKVPFPYKVKFTKIPRIMVWVSLGAIIHLTTVLKILTMTFHIKLYILLFLTDP